MPHGATAKPSLQTSAGTVAAALPLEPRCCDAGSASNEAPRSGREDAASLPELRFCGLLWSPIRKAIWRRERPLLSRSRSLGDVCNHDFSAVADVDNLADIKRLRSRGVRIAVLTFVSASGTEEDLVLSVRNSPVGPTIAPVTFHSFSQAMPSLSRSSLAAATLEALRTKHHDLAEKMLLRFLS